MHDFVSLNIDEDNLEEEQKKLHLYERIHLAVNASEQSAKELTTLRDILYPEADSKPREPLHEYVQTWVVLNPYFNGYEWDAQELTMFYKLEMAVKNVSK